MINKMELYNTFLKLLSFQSISGTEGEVEIANELVDMLSKIKVSEKNKLTTHKILIKNDKLKRFAIFSHLKGGESKDTIILTGHIDVVDVEEFSELKEYAFDPEIMTEKIKNIELPIEAKEDLDSGKWIFGRGTADMKFGISLHFELIKYYASLNDFDGNIIFLAVPGEESNSEGIRESIEFLYDYQIKNNLDYKMGFLGECFYYDKNKPDVNLIQYGSEGKLMPMMLFVGKSTHANNPFGGIDSNMILTEFFSRFQLNCDFISEYEGTWSEPPICLKLKDFKSHYSAKPAIFSLSYFNLPTINSNYDDIIKNLKIIGNETMKSVIEKINIKISTFNSKTNSNFKNSNFNYDILTYEELYEKALKKTNGNLNHLLDEFIKNESNKNLSIQDISGNILKFVYELSGLNGNSIIISISPPFYPSHLPSENTDGYKTIERIANNIIEYSKEFLNIKMELSKFYQISDLAFLPIGNIDSLDYIYNNMPGSKSLYNLSLEKMNSLNVPTIVLGAPGKDFHKITERLNIDYALNNLPKLYVFSINKILKNRR